MGLTASEVFGAGVWIELRFSPRHCWYHSSILLLLIPPFIAPMNIHTGNEGSLEMILWLIQAPAWFFQNIWPQKLLNLLVSWVYRDQMVWSRMWGDLSSWLVPDLICITTVIHWDQNEKIFFYFRHLCFIPFNKSIVFFPSSAILFRSLFPALPSCLILLFHLSFSSSHIYYSTFHFHCHSLSPDPSLPLPPIYFGTLSVLSVNFSPRLPSHSLPTSSPAPQAVVDGSETSVVLQHLSSLTEYQLAVFAVYANQASEALRGSETTRKFILTHKHTRRNALTKPRSNASVNIWDHQLITMAVKFDSHGSQTYWQWCTHNTRIRFLDFHSDPANTVCCDIITMYKTHYTWFVIMIPSWLNHAVCLSVCGRVCVCMCVCVCVCVYEVALPTVTGLQLLDVTHSTMKARWDSVEGVAGYMLLYAPLSGGGESDEKEVLKGW